MNFRAFFFCSLGNFRIFIFQPGFNPTTLLMNF
jgi:hypothetical protein